MIVCMSHLLHAASKATKVPPNKSFQRTAFGGR